MKINLEETEIQLKKRHSYPYKWYRKQNNVWDSYTNFIYSTPSWETLILKIEATVNQKKLDKVALFNYAINRWYNFWSAMAAEHIFNNCEDVVSALNTKNRLVDFTIKNIPFDHKTSVFPKHLNNNLAIAKKQKRELIAWFYQNQSIQQRYHLKNRLFVVVHESTGEHWKLKAEIGLLKKEIENYVLKFNPSQLQKFIFAAQTETLSDIIWVNK